MTQPETMTDKPHVRSQAIISGTYLTTDVKRVKRFFEEMLGMDCVEPKPGVLLAREAGHGPGGPRRGKPYWALKVIEREKIDNPQAMLNHWGVDVNSQAEVDKAHELVSAHGEAFGITRVQRPRHMHNSYSFYFTDVDNNWWEVEYRTPEYVYSAIRARGDWVETAA